MSKKLRNLHLIGGIIELFVALNGLIAGIMMILDPTGASMGMEEVVDIIPFTNLLIPAILLFSVNGLGQLFAGILSLKRHERSYLVTSFFGVGLLIWIIVQVVMLEGSINWLQYTIFGFGILEVGIGYSIFYLNKKNN